MKNKPSVFVALFALDERDGWFTPAIAQFLVSLSNAKSRALCLQVKVNTKPIDYARNCIVRDFLASGFDWLLCIDNDMAPPPNLLDMLDRAQEHMSILAPKFHLFATCLQKQAKNSNLPLTIGWQPLEKPPGENEWCELAWCGTGVVFIHRRVFERMGKQDWFRFIYGDDGVMVNSEDVNFFQKARRLGFSAWGNQEFEADHFKTVSLSALARSIGTMVPTPLTVLRQKGVSVTGEAPQE